MLRNQGTQPYYQKSKVLIVEDIVTTGGSIKELIDISNKYQANIIGIASIVDRNDKNTILDYPYETLLNYPSKSWEPEDCPLCENNIPIIKPGSTGK